MNQKNTIVFLGVVVIILIGMTIYFVTIKDRSQQSAQTPTAQQKTQPVANQPTQQNNTSIATVPTDRQTYRNEKYGFEFMYPKDKNVIITEPCPTGGTLVKYCIDIQTQDFVYRKTGSKVTVFINPTTELLTTGWFSAVELIKTEEIGLNEISWTNVYTRGGPSPRDYNREWISSLAVKNDITYNITVSYYPEDKDNYMEFYNQIFSTFKFVK